MSEFLISLDPSFTRTGISILNLKEKQIYFETASCKIGEKQFENVVHAAQNIVQQLKDIFSKRTAGSDYDLISESPLPLSSMSSALYALDSLIYNEFESHIKKTYNPAILRSRIHKHKYDKTDSVELANKYLNILSNSGYIILSDMGTKKKLCNDCAEAFLYTWLYLHELNHPDFGFDNTEEAEAYKLRMKELKKREKLLLKQSSINIQICKEI